MIAPPMQLSAMIETHGGALCFYLRACCSLLDVRKITALAVSRLHAALRMQPTAAPRRSPQSLHAEEP